MNRRTHHQWQRESSNLSPENLGRTKRKKQGAAKDAAEDQAKTSRRQAQWEMESFRKAFSVCLEAKGYMVKF